MTTLECIFVYDDEGAGAFSVREALHCFTSVFAACQVERISAQAIIDGKLPENDTAGETALCIGGGADLGYLRALGEHGCARISSFVRAGGRYVGICAGGYLACEHIFFDAHGPLSVCGARPLRFFAGTAVGPVNANFAYGSGHDTAAIVRVRLVDTNDTTAQVYLNGGFYLTANHDADPQQQRIIANYEFEPNFQPGTHPQYPTTTNAIALCRIGKGACLLSGVHFEYEARHLPESLQARRSSPVNLYGEHSNAALVKHLFKLAFND